MGGDSMHGGKKMVLDFIVYMQRTFWEMRRNYHGKMELQETYKDVGKIGVISVPLN